MEESDQPILDAARPKVLYANAWPQSSADALHRSSAVHSRLLATTSMMQ